MLAQPKRKSLNALCGVRGGEKTKIREKSYFSTVWVLRLRITNICSLARTHWHTDTILFVSVMLRVIMLRMPKDNFHWQGAFDASFPQNDATGRKTMPSMLRYV